MARLAFAVPCRRAVIDKFTNAASAHEIIDGLSTTQAADFGDPIEVELNVLTNWARENFATPEPDAFAKCTVVYPDGHRGKSAVLAVNLQKGPRVRNVFRFNELEFRGFGEAHFEIAFGERADLSDADWEIRARVPLTIQYVAEMPIGPIAGPTEEGPRQEVPDGKAKSRSKAPRKKG